MQIEDTKLQEIVDGLPQKENVTYHTIIFWSPDCYSPKIVLPAIDFIDACNILKEIGVYGDVESISNKY